MGPRAIQRWKKDYLEGGIENLLNYKRGKHKSNGTSGFTSYIELHQWLQENHLPTVTYRVVYHHATVKLNASLKVARKSHIKKDLSAIEDFKKQ